MTLRLLFMILQTFHCTQHLNVYYWHFFRHTTPKLIWLLEIVFGNMLPVTHDIYPFTRDVTAGMTRWEVCYFIRSTYRFKYIGRASTCCIALRNDTIDANVIKKTNVGSLYIDVKDFSEKYSKKLIVFQWLNFYSSIDQRNLFKII